MITERVKAYLDENATRYTNIYPSAAATLLDPPRAGRRAPVVLTKTVVIEAYGDPALLIVPAWKKVTLEEARGIVGSSDVRLPDPSEFSTFFRDCDVNAIPPIGSLFNLPVFADPDIADIDEIVFCCGGEDYLKLSWREYEMLVDPHIVAMTII